MVPCFIITRKPDYLDYLNIRYIRILALSIILQGCQENFLIRQLGLSHLWKKFSSVREFIHKLSYMIYNQIN